MLRFERLERDIDDFCEEEALLRPHDDIPDPITHHINKSRDGIFARHEEDKSGYRDTPPEFTG